MEAASLGHVTESLPALIRGRGGNRRWHRGDRRIVRCDLIIGDRRGVSARIERGLIITGAGRRGIAAAAPAEFAGLGSSLRRGRLMPAKQRFWMEAKCLEIVEVDRDPPQWS